MVLVWLFNGKNEPVYLKKDDLIVTQKGLANNMFKFLYLWKLCLHVLSGTKWNIQSRIFALNMVGNSYNQAQTKQHKTISFRIVIWLKGKEMSDNDTLNGWN